MGLAKRFARTLDTLWRRRTAKLRGYVIPRGVGQPQKFSRTVRDRMINRLLDQATVLLIRREGRSEFREVAPERRLRQIKGRGVAKRAENMLRWARLGLHGPIIYCFWKGDKCLYVGKGATWKRLKNYEKSAYLLQATCIEVFLVKSKSQLGKAECLATHLFEPRDKKIKPARSKWGKACPICQKHDAIRGELQALFRMK